MKAFVVKWETFQISFMLFQKRIKDFAKCFPGFLSSIAESFFARKMYSMILDWRQVYYYETMTLQ